MNGIAGEYLIIVNRMYIAEVGHLVIETQKRSSNDRSGSVGVNILWMIRGQWIQLLKPQEPSSNDRSGSSSFEQLRRESRGQGSGWPSYRNPEAIF